MAILSGSPDCPFHKTTYLRLSVTDRCDMRCIYCIPCRDAVGHVDAALSVDEIAVLVDAFARNGITKVRLTGGEPLVRYDLIDIVRRVAHTPGIRTTALTTNGVLLDELALDLAAAGLQRVNISIDTLNPATFRRITGQDALDSVLRGLDAAVKAGFEKVKVNAVVMRGVNDAEIPAIADIARRMPVEVRFIELMPLGHSAEQWREMYVPAAEIRERLGPLDPLPSEIGSPARRYRLVGSDGVVGIISPMSEDFCEACNRVRVSCCGKVRPCLRLPVEEGVRPLLGAPDLVERLGAMMDRLSCNKLSSALASSSVVQADAMCAIGG